MGKTSGTTKGKASKVRRVVARKQKRTYSLSAGSVAFVSAIANQVQLSDSEALDQLIQEKKTQRDREQINAQITAYYDSLSPEETEEEALWGDFAESQSPHE